MTHEHAADFIAGADQRPPGPDGQQINYDLIGELIGAAFDGCTSCQDVAITLVVEDAATCARLVELACVAVAGTLGGLPANLTSNRAPGLASPHFRRLARVGFDGHNHRLYVECAQMIPSRRRDAANTAVDLLVGIMTT
ncbi:hypothetical protein GCM10012275_38160 [Longimycelium tulufanense]|uniref:Uncharacterized protein n=1 Tax=Longimycelium tulufanense TaxID=907463 RepID=A0A8J3CGH0_9PSEU|nr:hypothetical protein [Longimycelium tulufanense]GGM63965.1 hypothetical protein GCM10012275_38160 [Longimycelium tulufanense]